MGWASTVICLLTSYRLMSVFWIQHYIASEKPSAGLVVMSKSLELDKRISRAVSLSDTMSDIGSDPGIELLDYEEEESDIPIRPGVLGTNAAVLAWRSNALHRRYVCGS